MIWTVLWWASIYFTLGTFVYWLAFVWRKKTPKYNTKYLIVLWFIWPAVTVFAIGYALKLIFDYYYLHR